MSLLSRLLRVLYNSYHFAVVYSYIVQEVNSLNQIHPKIVTVCT